MGGSFRGRPVRLRVEHLDQPIGLMTRHPRLSWQLPDGATEQIAYRIKAGTWDTGRVDSRESILIPYEGPDLVSDQVVAWSVKVWTDLGESDWAEGSAWETGLLDRTAWQASWVQPAPTIGATASSDRRYPSVTRPAVAFMGDFTTEFVATRARLYATAHGVYEVFLNGTRVGDMELTPGFTNYSSSLQVQAYDIEPYLRVGENRLCFVVSDGWYRGQCGGLRIHNLFGDELALLAQVSARGVNDETVIAGTGSHWTTSESAIRAADLMEGQATDLTVATTRAVDRHSQPVVIAEHDYGRLVSSPAPAVRRVSTLEAVQVKRTASEQQVFDFGQNITGWTQLRNLGPRGTHLTLRHGEALDPTTGEVTTANIRTDAESIEEAVETNSLPWDVSNLRRPLQLDQVVSDGVTNQFEPRHAVHGFRYVGIEGHPSPLRLGDVAGVVVHSDVTRTGWFECSDDQINKLHEAAVWSLRGNLCDIPTDNPTRERTGWTGDWQIFIEPATFLFDVAGISTKWLKDLASEQRSDGCVLDWAPRIMPTEDPGFSTAFPPGSAGWGDAIVFVPWQMYRAYGDEQVLRDLWPHMKAWVDFATASARNRRHPSREARSPRALPHEQYIRDSGFHWGEWWEPDQPTHFTQAELVETLSNADHGALATAYLYWSAKLLSKIGAIIGEAGEASRLGDLAKRTRHAWQLEFQQASGVIDPDRQANYVRALAFGLLSATHRDQAAARLADLVRAAGTHPATGFLSTGMLLPVLSEAGYSDLAYQLLRQTSRPSWLYMIDHGATTIWEAWDGIGETGEATHSLNQYSKGAVVSFLHRHVAGIRVLEPGYRRFEISPTIGGGLTWASAKHDSPYGRIEADWSRHPNGAFQFRAVVPPGTTAHIKLPSGEQTTVRAGEWSYTCEAGSFSRDREGPVGPYHG